MSRQTSTRDPRLAGRFEVASGWARRRLAALACVLILISTLAGMGQEAGNGIVAGVVISTWDGKAVPSVAVTVRGTTLATQTDASGRYELKNVPAGDQVFRFSKSGFASAVVTDVRVLSGQSTTVDGNLRPEFFDMEEYEVTAEEFTQQTEQIHLDRQQSSSLMEAIGSEKISRLGATDASQIVGQVTGVSVVGGKFAVVRGLSDRYTRTLMNGVEVPSADPYRSSPQLDLFPAGMIDRVSVSKTFTPDQPGGTGGGTIDIITKSFPEKPFFTIKSGTSYNPDSNLIDDFLADPSTSMSMYDLPSDPKQLKSDLFNLNEAPPVPGPSSSRETQARAESRRKQADTHAELLQDLGTADFAGTQQSSPLNSSFNASAGRTVPLFDRNLGMFSALNYTRNFRQLDPVQLGRYSGNGALEREGQEIRSNVNTDWGANVNLAYAVSENSQVGFNFMLAHSTDEEARYAVYDVLTSREGDSLVQWQLHDTDREVINYQLRGGHDFPALADSTLDWVVGLANTTQNEPDHRFMNYFLDSEGRPSLGDSALPIPTYPSRYYREINEDGLNSKVDWTWPIESLGTETKLKVGLADSQVDRNFKEQYFGYTGTSEFDQTNPNSYLNNPAYLNYTATYLGGIRTNFNFARTINLAAGRPYTASSEISAGYLMLDVGVLSWFRLVGGARWERTYMDIKADVGSSEINQTDLLPAISGIITLYTNLNLRLSYAETVARPSFREKAPILNYLPDLNVFAFGNPDLQMSAIKSYDARVEWFPAPGDLLSVGIFYKAISQPIERYLTEISSSEITWINRDDADVMGVEFEARKSLAFLSPHFEGLTLGANVALMNSETDLFPEEYKNKTDPDGDGVIDFPTDKSRPLYDQSPYVVNLDISYDHPKSGTSLTVAANMTGPRILLTSGQGPDIYEHSPITLDAGISQKFGKLWTARFGVRNLLNPEYRQTYGDNYNDPIYQAFSRGRTFSVSLTAEF